MWAKFREHAWSHNLKQTPHPFQNRGRGQLFGRFTVTCLLGWAAVSDTCSIRSGFIHGLDERLVWVHTCLRTVEQARPLSPWLSQSKQGELLGHVRVASIIVGPQSVQSRLTVRILFLLGRFLEHAHGCLIFGQANIRSFDVWLDSRVCN